MSKKSGDINDRERTYSITELCKEFEVTPRTLRFYEQKGLLSPARRGWTRLFSYQRQGPAQADPARQARRLFAGRDQGNAGPLQSA
jgi:DNA-binding transcriptional MerR regulator